MSATPPQQLEGTEAPSQVEFLWERYRKYFNLVVALLLCAAVGSYFWRQWQQREVDKRWTEFSVTTGLRGTYTDLEANKPSSLADELAKVDLAKLEKDADQADASQRPLLLLAVARRAMQERDWTRAEAALGKLESEFPKHPLVVSSPYPVQVREPVKQEDENTHNRNQKPVLKPALAGSAVSLLRQQIADAKAFSMPARFAKPEIPADAPRIKFELSGDNGSFVIALMDAKAHNLCQEFLRLVRQEGGPFWKDQSIDEIQRNGSGMMKRPRQLHIGYESTKDADKSKWTKTDPSKHEVEFEDSGLSHFPGAVAAQVGTDGKACADRFYVVADDCAEEDGSRVVFAYVVEGLENVTKVCNASMSAQENDSGIGVPSDRITITNVTEVK